MRRAVPPRLRRALVAGVSPALVAASLRRRRLETAIAWMASGPRNWKHTR